MVSLPDEIKSLTKDVPERYRFLFGGDLEKGSKPYRQQLNLKKVFTASTYKHQHKKSYH